MLCGDRRPTWWELGIVTQARVMATAASCYMVLWQGGDLLRACFTRGESARQKPSVGTVATLLHVPNFACDCIIGCCTVW